MGRQRMMTAGMYLNMSLERLRPELEDYLKTNYQEQELHSPNAAAENKDAGTHPFPEKADLTLQLLEKADLTPRQEKDLSELLSHTFFIIAKQR